MMLARRPALALGLIGVVAVVLFALVLRVAIGGVGQPAARTGATSHPGIPSPAATAPAGAIASPKPVIVTPRPAADADQGVQIAEQFGALFETSQPGDTVDTIRARLRPYDTYQFDASFNQGGGSGAAPPPTQTATVTGFQNLGLAPDGHLVVVVAVTIRGASGLSTATPTLYLARTAAGWRVDEVAP